jgi:hypothetical protein
MMAWVQADVWKIDRVTFLRGLRCMNKTRYSRGCPRGHNDEVGRTCERVGCPRHGLTRASFCRRLMSVISEMPAPIKRR